MSKFREKIKGKLPLTFNGAKRETEIILNLCRAQQLELIEENARLLALLQDNLSDIKQEVNTANLKVQDITSKVQDITSKVQDVAIKVQDVASNAQEIASNTREIASNVTTAVDINSAEHMTDRRDSAKYQELFYKYLMKAHGLESHIYQVVIYNENYLFKDGIMSYTAPAVAREINRGDYIWKDIDFRPGDVVVDIGANVGIVSIVLAKLFPFLRIYSFEPVKPNYDNFISNIALNHIPGQTINAVNAAITGDGRAVSVQYDPYNSGCSNIFGRTYDDEISSSFAAKSITLPEIFNQYGIDHVKLLKMDCEGAEYEILKATPTEYLKRIEHFRGEFHEGDGINGNASELIEYIGKHIEDIGNISICRNTIEI